MADTAQVAQVNATSSKVGPDKPPPASGPFKWVVWGLMVSILILGLLRNLWVPEENDGGVASAEEASLWSKCLPTVPVPANVNITVMGFDGEALTHADIGNRTHPKIKYVATAGVLVDPISQDINAALNAVGPVNIEKDKEIRVSKGEFWLTGNIEVRLDSGERLIIREPERLRMGPADGQTYVVRLSSGVEVEAPKPSGSRVLPAGVEGDLKLASNKGLTFKTLEATLGKPFLYNTTTKIVPIRAFGEKGPSAVSIETAGVNLTSENLAACAISGKERYNASITEVSEGQGGLTKLTLSLPSALLPEAGLPTPIKIAVTSLDGKFMAHGALDAYPRLWGAVIATLLTAALFGAILKTRYMTTERYLRSDKTDWSRWFSGLFITDGEKDPSLSLFQVFFWTVITVWGLFYTYAVTGNLVQMTPQMMTLLGIAGTGSVIARWIGIAQAGGADQAVTATPSSVTEPFRFWDILNTRGRFDLLKLQLLVYTLLLGIYVVCRVAESAAFPVLDSNTLLLLGISQGVYIGGKLGGATPLAKAQALKFDLDLNTELTTNLPDEIKSAEQARDEEKAKKDSKIKEKSDLEAQGKVASEALKGEIEAVEKSITQWETVIEEKKKKLKEATAKVVELKASLEKVVKEDLKLQVS